MNKSVVRRGVGVLAACVAAGWIAPGAAQVGPAAGASAPRAPASAARGSAGDGNTPRVQQQVDNVFKWIKAAGNIPRKGDAATAADAAKRAAPKPVAAASGAGRGASVIPAPAPSPSAPASEPTSAATEPVSTPVQDAASVAAAPPVAPPPVPSAPKLVVLEREEPSFPPDLVRSMGSGSVKLRLTVERNGSVGDVEVLSSSHRRLNRAAIDAVKAWRFEPIAEPQTAQVEVGFSLD